MPWKASSVMEERLRFVARLLDGEAMTDACRDFGVSRKTGYKRAENLATRRQPVRQEAVTHVLGTFCYPCLRAGQFKNWRRGRDSPPAISETQKTQ
jgi:hypothetical protein